METEDLINYLDELLVSQTGKHLDNLQLSILKGVLNGQKYADIAENYHCSNGHAKDKAYELWKILSEALGEDINKSNFKATIQRLGIANIESPIVGNKVKVRNINLCSNTDTNRNKDLDFKKNNRNNKEDFDLKVSIKTIKKLKNLGLNNEQIAEALDLSLEDINKAIN